MVQNFKKSCFSTAAKKQQLVKEGDREEKKERRGQALTLQAYKYKYLLYKRYENLRV